jgi:2-C-methyl-D-erythritol 4-phosphate cytidylyltransferase
MKKIAIILSGGKGERFENSLPKQFVKLAGKSVIEYTIDVFNRHKDIDEIIIVSKEDYIEKTWEIVKKNSFFKVEKIISGGIDRFGSTHSAIKALVSEGEDTKVLFHDAVRPLVDEYTITKCLEALDDYNAIDTAIDATDTIIEIDNDACIVNIPNRAFMKRGQTPQGFRLGTIRLAYQKAIDKNKRTFTCDCGVVKEMLPDTKIKVVKSSEKNIKITYPIDLHIAEKYIQMGTEYQLDEISLENLKDKNIIIFGNSSGIGAEIEAIAKEYGATVYGCSRSSGVDISKREDIIAFLKDKKDINIVINTASILIKKPLEFLDFERIDEIVNINYIGAINIAYLVKPLLEKTQGMLINFASSSYTRGRANYALYSSSKSAIVNLTQALSDEWDKVSVNCINPERTKTPMREKNFGYEPPETLLESSVVAKKSLKLALSNLSGIILDVKR